MFGEALRLGQGTRTAAVFYSLAMTANALMSVSLEPPLIVVSVRRRARLHAALQAAGGYGVTVLGEGQEVQARRFAGDCNRSPQCPPAERRAAHH